ncbi:MAG: ribosome maturation factor RimM [Candidatus Limnocylindrales bacterium]
MPAPGAAEPMAVGRVRGLHGLRGAVRVEVLSDDPRRFMPGSVLHVEGDPAPLTVAWQHADGPGMLIRFAQITTREAAEGLRDAYLVADIPAEALAEGAAWWHDVVGAAVSTTTGEPLGQVVDLFRSGGAEVLVVEGAAYGEVLVPMVGPIVTVFAPGESRVVVDADALGLDPPSPPRPRGRRTSKLAAGS